MIAEDLGVVPDFIRASLERMGVPGFKVFRWERHWEQPEEPFIDPTEYNEASVATSGTHDTETLAAWWDALDEDEREKVTQLPSVARHLPQLDEKAAIVRAVLASGSRYTILPIQDLFGWSDRINTPATVDDDNWTWRLPWPADRLEEIDEPRAAADRLREWTIAAKRAPHSVV
jgi:4-alpha-glucanotransferase